MVGEDPFTAVGVGPAEPVAWLWLWGRGWDTGCATAEGRAAASEGWGVRSVRAPGWGCVSGPGGARTGDEGAWQCPWLDVDGVPTEGTSGPQCSGWGVAGDGSVGAAQWLRGSACAGACDCDVSLADDGSVLLLWFTGDA